MMKNIILLIYIFFLNACTISVVKNDDKDVLGFNSKILNELYIEKIFIEECEIISYSNCYDDNHYLLNRFKREVGEFNKNSPNNDHVSFNFYRKPSSAFWPRFSLFTLGIIPVFHSTEFCLETTYKEGTHEICGKTNHYNWLPFMAVTWMLGPGQAEDKLFFKLIKQELIRITNERN